MLDLYIKLYHRYVYIRGNIVYNRVQYCPQFQKFSGVLERISPLMSGNYSIECVVCHCFFLFLFRVCFQYLFLQISQGCVCGWMLYMPTYMYKHHLGKRSTTALSWAPHLLGMVLPDDSKGESIYRHQVPVPPKIQGSSNLH